MLICNCLNELNEVVLMCSHNLYFEIEKNENKYGNDPKFLDRLIWANSADPDQTAPRGAV